MEAPASDASCAPNEPCAAPETKDQQLEQSIANSPAYDPLNPATFVFPKPLQGTTVTIEFCDRRVGLGYGLPYLPVIKPTVSQTLYYGIGKWREDFQN
ncbi:hypothetical protein HHX47_DHR5000211 [Lentinula edodes]|nr:hypothetical protein HHX47_DHR5000211 [Lentinula edodes]